MQAELEKAAKQDEDTWKNLKCWCGDNKEEKTKAVEDMRGLIERLQSDIGRAAAKEAELTTQVEQIKADISEAEQALAQATEIRAQEAAAFHEQEVGLTSGIELLKGAIAALSKHHSAMLQGHSTEQLKVLRPQLRGLIYRNLAVLGWMRTSPHRDAFLHFIGANGDLLEPTLPQARAAEQAASEGIPVSFLAERRASASAPPFKSYAPQSGAIFGMLRQMKESFEEDLPMMQAEEARKVKMFAELKGAKEASLAQLRESQKEKTGGIADAKEDLATAKNDLEDTNASLSADQRFLLEMIDRCMEGEYEWERRSKARLEEIEAVSEAIAILSKGAARDGQQRVFGKSSFLQVGRQALGTHAAVAAVRDQAVRLVRRRLGGSLDAGALLMALKEDPFAKVSQAIDGLIAKLRVEQADEVKHKDFCTDGLHENEVDSERKAAELEGLNASALALASKAQSLESEIEALQTDIKDMQVSLQLASEIRQKENHEFVRAMGDTLAMRDALEKAHAKLASVYTKKVTLLQAAPPPSSLNDTAPWGSITSAPEFDGDYQKHEGSPGVLTLLQKLIGDTKVFQDGLNHDEQGAQDAYEKLVGDTNDSIKANSRLIADKREELAATKEELDATKVDLSKTVAEVEALGDTRAQLHKQCDWLLGHFTERQEARASEMRALHEIKALIRGMVP
mmetsp:Transcript_36054/g.96863  ORF Transcript_36054/g.96863 Transcript_36054/m.96863 type:complete len:682 (+) Transcript_36054:299-2344(+)